jgi:hypothetical protein
LSLLAVLLRSRRVVDVDDIVGVAMDSPAPPAVLVLDMRGGVKVPLHAADVVDLMPWLVARAVCTGPARYPAQQLSAVNALHRQFAGVRA